MDRATALDLLDWAHRAQNIEDGSDNWMETCGVGSLEYHECVGDYTTVWKRGYSALFDILMVKNVLFSLRTSVRMLKCAVSYFLTEKCSQEKQRIATSAVGQNPLKFTRQSC